MAQLFTYDVENFSDLHYSDVIISAMVSQITGVSLVCKIVCLGAYQSKLSVTGLCDGNPPVTGGFPSHIYVFVI